MVNLIFLTYRDTVNFFLKKPQLILLLVIVALVNISLSTALAGYNDLFFFLSQLISWTVNIFLFWFVFNWEDATSSTLPDWFKKYYFRVWLQLIGGFILFSPIYAILLAVFGKDGLAGQPGHSILMFSMSVWMYFVHVGILWLCFQNEGFFRNIGNAIQDVFQSFGFYLILRIIALVFACLSVFLQKSFGTFTGLACGLLVLNSILFDLSWIAIIFGFLKLRKQTDLTRTSEN